MKLFVLLSLLLCACESPVQSSPLPTAASLVEHAIAETDLPSVVLTREAIERLQIQTGSVQANAVPHTRLVGGEVIVPPGRTNTVNAPVAGAVHFVGNEPRTPGSALQGGAAVLRLQALAPVDRDARVRVQREVSAAQANLAALELRVTRNQALVEQRSGSQRALEEAVAARDVAAADLTAARTRSDALAHDPLLSDVALIVRAPSNGVIRQLLVAEGQVISAGAALFEIVAVDGLQVRVPVYSGDVGRLDANKLARVRRNREQSAIAARFVPGPPTAEPDRSTVDRYLMLPSAAELVPGERVLVELPLTDEAHALTVPASALVLDAWGGAWVYRCDGERFTRVRVDPLRRVDSSIVLASGPAVGSCIVTVGAAELFGAEFPPGH